MCPFYLSFSCFYLKDSAKRPLATSSMFMDSDICFRNRVTAVPCEVMINILKSYTEKGQRSNRFPHQGIVL